MNSKMKVTEVRIKNVLGINEMEISPGSVSLIQGKNGTGKTSTIEALKAAIGGGNVAEMRNIHADGKPEIVLHLEGDENYIIRKTATTTTVKKQVGDSAAYEEVKSPQRFLSSIFDVKLSNPIKFLTADKKDRVNLMLEAIDLPYSFDDLCKAMGMNPDYFDAIPTGLHPLTEIGMHRQFVFNRRTGVNSDLKAKKSAADQMLRSVPRETPSAEGLEEKRSELAGKRSEYDKFSADMESTKKELISEAEQALSDVKAKSEVTFLEKKSEIEKEALARLEAVKTELDKVNESASQQCQQKTAEIVKDYEAKSKKNESILPEITALEKEISTLEERQNSAIEIDTIKKQAKEFEEEAEELEEKSNGLTESLNSLDEYKAEMCANLPIEGLEIVNNQIAVDGVKWEHLNTAKQIELAVKVAALRGRKQKMPIMFVDGAEALDNESLELLKSHIEAENVQVFIGRVSNDELNVNEVKK
jgi:DNA repair exonuclease SbcCD ATPase subunit